MTKTPGIPAPEDRAAQEWFRTRGVPLVIPASKRAQELIPRSIPLTSWLALSGLGYALAWPLLIYLSSEETTTPGQNLGIDENLIFNVSLGFSLLIPVALLFIPWLLRRALTTLKNSTQYLLGIISFCAAVLVYSPLMGESQGLLTPFYFSWFGAVLFALILLTSIFFELDTITVWAAKRTLHELWSLMPMIAKVLPTLMLAVLFAFVNGDIWRVADALSLKRTFDVVSVLLLLATFVAVTTSIERTKRLLGAHQDDSLEDFTATEYKEISRKMGRPWPALIRRIPEHSLTKKRQHRIMRWSEWGNLVALPTLSQLIQALLFGLLVLIFFMWFGTLAIPTETVTSWLGHSPAQLTLAGLTLPISAVLAKVALILAGFASLNFVASTATDERYAKDFLQPMMDYLRETVVLRNIYRAAHQKN